jgi:deoxyribodipyrimidine photo-lyase
MSGLHPQVWHAARFAAAKPDAAPYFRAFNPMLQGEKFDSHGAYVRRWGAGTWPRLPARLIHQPRTGASGRWRPVPSPGGID